MRTVESVGATRETLARTARNGGDVPTISSNIDWLVTARARAGIAATPALLLYVTGGLAVAGISHHGWINPDVDANGNPVVDGNSTNVLGRTTRFGWTAGGGVEARLIGRASCRERV